MGYTIHHCDTSKHKTYISLVRFRLLLVIYLSDIVRNHL